LSPPRPGQVGEQLDHTGDAVEDSRDADTGGLDRAVPGDRLSAHIDQPLDHRDRSAVRMRRDRACGQDLRLLTGEPLDDHHLDVGAAEVEAEVPPRHDPRSWWPTSMDAALLSRQEMSIMLAV